MCYVICWTPSWSSNSLWRHSIYTLSVKKNSAPGILQMQHSNCFIWNGIHHSGFALFWKLKKKKNQNGIAAARMKTAVQAGAHVSGVVCLRARSPRVIGPSLCSWHAWPVQPIDRNTSSVFVLLFIYFLSRLVSWGLLSHIHCWSQFALFSFF